MAEDPLSMSLDDIIKQKAVKGSGAGASRQSNGKSGSRSGARKRFTEKLQVTVANNSRKPSRPRARVLTVVRGEEVAEESPADESRKLAALEGNAKWSHDKYTEGPARRTRGVRSTPAESGTKLLISNLDFKVTDDDVRELFENCGTLKRAGILYDRSGRSEGEAEVVFVNREDAAAALQQYNNLALDGKPMKITMAPASSTGATLSSGISISRGPSVGGRSGLAMNGTFRTAIAAVGASSGGASRAPRSSAPSRTVPRGRASRASTGTVGGRKTGAMRSASDLDADLDAYMHDA